MVSQVETQRAGPRRLRNRRGEGTRLRDELIEAARQLLMTAARESDVSIRAVTRAAGAAPQSFYLQFASLDELLYAVYAVEFESLRHVMAQAASDASDPVAQLRAVCDAYCAYAALAWQRREAEPFLVAATLWACLHGILTLRADRPAFPWPPLADMIATVVEQALVTPRPGA